MKFRWTIQDLKDLTDLEILRGLVVERKSELNYYTPFSQRLGKIYSNLSIQINEEREKKRDESKKGINN